MSKKAAVKDRGVKSIIIIGRRWFRRSYGNTYFSADIIVDGKKVHTIPKEYGYGDHYADRAMDWLDENGYISRRNYDNGGHEARWQTAERMGIAISCAVSDVARERDL